MPLTSTSPFTRGDDRSDLTAQLLQRARSARRPDERQRLLDEAVLVNRPVADGVAQRYRNRGIALEDLHQVAYEGLTKAVFRFDPALAEDLLTYAVPMIRGELQRCLRDHGWSVRPPRRVQQMQRRIVDATEELAQRLGREPDDREIVDCLAVDDVEYREAKSAFGCKRAASLDQPVGEDADATLGSMIAVEDDGMTIAEARLLLAPLLRRLPERDREILRLRFFEGMTQQEIGDRLGVTQMQVSRLLTRILSGLRTQVAA